jgi:hypothetical protein
MWRRTPPSGTFSFSMSSPNFSNYIINNEAVITATEDNLPFFGVLTENHHLVSFAM